MRESLISLKAAVLSAVAFSAAESLAQTSWQITQIPVTGYAENPFTDGRTVVWNDLSGVHKYVDGVQATLAATGLCPVVYGDKFAWVGRDPSISNRPNTLVYEDGTGPSVVLAAKPDSDPLPRITSFSERPRLVGDQLAFSYMWTDDPRYEAYQVGLYEKGAVTCPLNPAFDVNTYGGSFFPSTNGLHVIWTTEYQTGQEQVFRWSRGRSARRLGDDYRRSRLLRVSNIWIFL